MSTIKQRIKQMIKQQMDGHIYDEETVNFKTRVYDVKMRRHGRMTDPIALFRPQVLYSWHGTVNHKPTGQSYRVFFIAGTDDGMCTAEVVVETTNENIRKKLWTGWRNEMYGCVRNIIPEELQ